MMDDAAQPVRCEARWPVILTIGLVIVLYAVLPQRIQLLPLWGAYVTGLAVLIPIIAVQVASGRAPWRRIERGVVVFFFVGSLGMMLANLANLVDAMIHRSTQLTGEQLLASSVVVWVTNVLIFSLLYWQIDRGGPEARVKRLARRTDWLFPQESAPPEDVPAGWRPTFVDYLYLAYSTATAFSTTEVAPLTSRAKLLMMSQSTISLVTILVVAARSINIIGS